MRLLALGFFGLLGLALPATAQVKLGSNQVCYSAQDPYYDRIATSRVFGTMVDCENAGGRDRLALTDPTGQALVETGRVDRSLVPAPVSLARTYRDFAQVAGANAWASFTPHSCRDIKDQLLANLSDVPVQWGRDACRIDFGHWRDAITGARLTDPERIDLFHLVPLDWAMERGAAAWSAPLRHQFYTDKRNLRTASPDGRAILEGRTPLDIITGRDPSTCALTRDFASLAATYRLALTGEEHQFLTTSIGAHCTPTLESIAAAQTAQADLQEVQRAHITQALEMQTLEQDALRAQNAPPAPAYIRLPDGTTRALTPAERWGETWVEQGQALGMTRWDDHIRYRDQAGQRLLHYIEEPTPRTTPNRAGLPETTGRAPTGNTTAEPGLPRPPIALPGQYLMNPNAPIANSSTAQTPPTDPQNAGARPTDPAPPGQNTIGSPGDLGDLGEIALPPELQGLDRLLEDAPELDQSNPNPVLLRQFLDRDLEPLLQEFAPGVTGAPQSTPPAAPQDTPPDAPTGQTTPETTP